MKSKQHPDLVDQINAGKKYAQLSQFQRDILDELVEGGDPNLFENIPTRDIPPIVHYIVSVYDWLDLVSQDWITLLPEAIQSEFENYGSLIPNS